MSRAKKTCVIEAAWRQLALEVLDVTRCNGSAFCVAACAVDALAMDGAAYGSFGRLVASAADCALTFARRAQSRWFRIVS